MNRKTKSTRIIIVIAVTLIVSGVWSGSGGPSAIAAKDSAVMMVPANFSELARQVKPSVVNIRTVKTVDSEGPVFKHFFGKPFKDRRDRFHDFWGPFHDRRQRQFKQRSLGSGFIVDRQGFIVTNNHVVEGADQIKVRLADEREFDAEIVGRDPKTDVALIRIEPPDDLVPLSMGNSDDLAIGAWVVAVGSPFGLEQTVTAGIVSAKGRVIGAGPYDDFIQTDASINPGNSGGPLINMSGKVVGINTAIVRSGQGIGFAIPINMAEDIIGQLKASGKVTRGWLGVAIQDLTPDVAAYYELENQKGALVTQVFKGDPAEKAGIKAKDIIVAVDGQRVAGSRELSRAVADIKVGKRTRITLYRAGKKKTVYVTLGERAAAEARMQAPEVDEQQVGLMLTALDQSNARRFGFDLNETGVLVIRVKAGSRAERSGIKRGDLIKEANRVAVSQPEELIKLIEKYGKKKPVRLLVKRDSGQLVVITLES